MDGVQHQLAGGSLGLVVDADDGIGVEVLHFADDGALGHLGDGAGRTDEDETRAVGLALVDDVPGTVYIHMPDLVRHQVADGDHSRAVDAVDGGVLGNVGEECVQGGDIGHVALVDVCALGQVPGSLLAPEDEGTHGLAIGDQMADDCAAQVAGRAGDDVKLVVGDGIHCIFLHDSWIFFVFSRLGWSENTTGLFVFYWSNV